MFSIFHSWFCIVVGSPQPAFVDQDSSTLGPVKAQSGKYHLCR